MSEKKTTPIVPDDEILRVFHEVCDLTDSKCKEAFEKYEKSKDMIDLVNNVFETLETCDTEFCNMNKGEMMDKLNKFLKKAGEE